MKSYVCLDVGGTFIKHGAVDEKGVLLESSFSATQAMAGGQAVLENLMGIVKVYQKKYDISGVCISSTGVVDHVEGSIQYASRRMPEYAGIQIKKRMEKGLGIPCEVENDVNCAGLAESISGAGKDSDINLILTIGTGIGGCVTVNKKVFHGFNNVACEVGYMQTSRGEFMEIASTSALCESVAKRKEETVKNWNGVRIFEEAKKGDAVCVEEVENLVQIIGEGIANICYVVNPEVVVVGGEIMAQGEYLCQRIEKAMKSHLIPIIGDNIRLKTAHYQNDAGMIGAYYHFCERQNCKM